MTMSTATGAYLPPDPTPDTPVSLWRAIRDAVAGTHYQNYTEGAVDRSIFLLAVPMVLEMAMESIFAIADIFWVSRLGADAVATVGITESLMTIVYTLAMGLSIGAMAMIARRTGEQDSDAAARTAVQVLALGGLVSLTLGVIGWFTAPSLLAIMGASPSVVESGGGFARVMLAGNASVFLLFLVNAVFRGVGDAAVAMRALWLANAINIVLGPLFIFGMGPFPELGVTGAAVATTTGRSIGFLYALSRLVRPGGRITVGRRHLALEPATMVRLLRLSGSGTFQVFVSTGSWIALVRIVSQFGSTALAGYTIAIRMVMFALLPAWGLSNAAATMVGQSLGARKPERAAEAVWTAGRFNLYFLGGTGAVFLLLAPYLVRLFTTDPAVTAEAVLALRLVALGFPFYAYGMVLTAAFNGAGDTWTPTLLNLACFWALEVPLGWALATRTPLGASGVYTAIAVAFSVIAVASAVLFRRGAWKTQHV